MILRSCLLTFAFLLLACTDEPGPELAGPEPAWLTDYDQALALAREQGKPLLLDFTGSDWCPPCIQLERTVFRSERFREWSEESVVLLKVDFPKRKELPAGQLEANLALQRRYRIDGYPTIIALDPEGRELARWSGYGGLDADAWIDRFERETGQG